MNYRFQRFPGHPQGLGCFSIFNEVGDFIHSFGNPVAILDMPSPLDIQQALEAKFPGCELLECMREGRYGSTITITDMKIPTADGMISVPVSYLEEPHDGDYENGWYTAIII